ILAATHLPIEYPSELSYRSAVCSGLARAKGIALQATAGQLQSARRSRVMPIGRLILRSTPAAVLLFCTAGVCAQDSTPQVVVQWNAIRSVTKTTPTLQVVVNPPLRRGTAVHDGAFRTLHDIGADYVRYVPWLPYPRLGVAELEPPKDG